MSLKDLLIHIDELQAQINSHGKLDKDTLKKINYKFRLDWNYNSNVMEGNSLTKMETRTVMINNITVEGKPLKDVLEMRGHDNVISDILKIGKGEMNLSEARIKEVHKGIMYEDKPEKKKGIGIWKTDNNYLYNYKNERVDFTPHGEVKEKMHELVNWLSAQYEKIKAKEKGALHPVLLAFEFHLRYVTIHPFYDGNGRTSRIFTNLILIAFGYPPVIVKLEEKTPYYQYLADIQSYGGSPDLFYEFMGNLLVRSQEIVLSAIEGKDIEERDDLDKKLSILKMEIANVDVDNEVQVQFSQNAFLKIYDSWLSELMRGLITKIKKFDDLFVTPSHYVAIRTGQHHGMGGQSISENFINRNPDEIINTLKDSLLKQNTFISADTTVSIHATYGTFKKGALNNPFGCNYYVDINFDYLKYEIYIRKFSVYNDPSFSKELKDTLEGNTAIKTVYFDTEGRHYFNAFKEEDGRLFVNLGEKGKAEIVHSYSVVDILNGRIKDGGIMRFIEPRLLHKPLTETEIEELCKQMGDTIYDHIDYFTRQAGLR